jgi:hypothetical protein
MSEQDQTAGATSTPRRTFAMTIVAQDPSIGNDRGMLRATVPVPADRLEPGPRSHRFQVIDYDATRRVLLSPATLAASAQKTGDWGWVEPDPFCNRSDPTSWWSPTATRTTCRGSAEAARKPSSAGGVPAW